MLAEADEQAVARRYLLIGPQRHLVRIECRDRIRGKRPLGGVGQRMYCMKDCACGEMRPCGMVLFANGVRVLPTVVSGS